ncbi:MAG: hypothetical protein HKN47_06930 [Pirellulaceae bacterium]|nr:hypothetical protein [Pirellulaceae bacterium]
MLHTPAWELLHQRDPAATRKTMQSWMRIDQEHPTAADTVAAINSLWAAVAILEFNIDNHEEQLLQLSQSHWDRRKPHDRHAPRESMDQAFAFADACMRAFDLTKNERFKTLATTYVQSWVTQISDSAAGERRPTEANSPDDASLSYLPTVAGESCLTLWTATHDQDYQQVVERIAEVIEHSVGSPNNKYNTAEDYGRVIHFLNRASEVLEKPNYRDMAILVADEAMEKLHVRETGMFRSRVGVDRCDATDGPGWLLLALLSLDGDDPTESSSLRF